MDAINYKDIQYKSDFLITLQCDAGWETPFCIKFWTDAPGKGYFVGMTNGTYTRCKVDDTDPKKLTVLFDDHGLGCGNLMMQMAYHVTEADFPGAIIDQVQNQQAVTTDIDGTTYQVRLAFEGEDDPEIQYELPAYYNEAQRIANEEQRIANEEQRIADEQTRIRNEQERINHEQARQNNESQRIRNEQTRINQEEARVREFATLKRDAQEATTAANYAAALANQKAQLAADKAQLAADKAALAQDAANLANQKAQLAADKAALANDAAALANEKAALAQQKAEYAKEQGDYAKQQGDYAKEQGDYAKRKGDEAAADHTRAENDHTRAENDHTQAGTDHQTAAADHTQAGTDHTASSNATSAANSAAEQANTKAGLAAEKAALADEKATEAGRVNATISGTTLTITDRNGQSTSVDTKGSDGAPGPIGPKICAIDFGENGDTFQMTNVFGYPMNITRIAGVNITKVKLSYGTTLNQEITPGTCDVTIADGQVLTIKAVRTSDLQRASVSMRFGLVETT